MQDDTVDSAIARLAADGLTQPVLTRINGRYYVKTDNTPIYVTDCSCFAEAAEFLFMCFFVFSVCYPPQLTNFYNFFERILGVLGSSHKLLAFFRKLNN